MDPVTLMALAGVAQKAAEPPPLPVTSSQAGGGTNSSVFNNNASIIMPGGRQSLSNASAQTTTPNPQQGMGATMSNLSVTNSWILPVAIGAVALISVVLIIKLVKK